MLKVGGENVAASEIEQVIAIVPGVREAAVVAKKHPMLDEVPVVFIIPHAGVKAAPPDLHDTVMAACRNALADFKVPREIHFAMTCHARLGEGRQGGIAQAAELERSPSLQGPGFMRSASPIDPSERIGTIDILRGIALFIVLIINTATEFRFQSSNSLCLLQKQRIGRPVIRSRHSRTSYQGIYSVFIPFRGRSRHSV